MDRFGAWASEAVAAGTEDATGTAPGSDGSSVEMVDDVPCGWTSGGAAAPGTYLLSGGATAGTGMVHDPAMLSSNTIGEMQMFWKMRKSTTTTLPALFGTMTALSSNALRDDNCFSCALIGELYHSSSLIAPAKHLTAPAKPMILQKRSDVV